MSQRSRRTPHVAAANGRPYAAESNNERQPPRDTRQPGSGSSGSSGSAAGQRQQRQPGSASRAAVLEEARPPHAKMDDVSSKIVLGIETPVSSHEVSDRKSVV